MYCLSSLDEAVLDEFCTDLHGAAPPTNQPCLVPCADQCELSDWSDWTQCTATCGPQGGTQTRSREIKGLFTRNVTAPVPVVVTVKVYHFTNGGRAFWQTEGGFGPFCLSKTPSPWTQHWTLMVTFKGHWHVNITCKQTLKVADQHNELFKLIHTASESTNKSNCALKLFSLSVYGPWILLHCFSGQKQGEAPCVPEDQLKQRRPCNQRPCRQFLWQVGPWSKCTASINVTAQTCVGSTSGKRKREAYCQLNYGKITLHKGSNSWSLKISFWKAMNSDYVARGNLVV